MDYKGRGELDHATPGVRRKIPPYSKSSAKTSPRNLARGVWELARLHTREAWLCWYPAGAYELLQFQNLGIYNLADTVLVPISMGRLSIGRNARCDVGFRNFLSYTLRYMEQCDGDSLRFLHIQVSSSTLDPQQVRILSPLAPKVLSGKFAQKQNL